MTSRAQHCKRYRRVKKALAMLNDSRGTRHNSNSIHSVANSAAVDLEADMDLKEPFEPQAMRETITGVQNNDIARLPQPDTWMKDLARVFVEHNVPHATIKAILEVLKPQLPELPLDPQTLLDIYLRPMRGPVSSIRGAAEPPSSDHCGQAAEIATLINANADRLGKTLKQLDLKVDAMLAAVTILQSDFTEMRQCILFSKPPEVVQTYVQFTDVFGDCLPLATDAALVEFDETLLSPEKYKLLVRYLLRTCGGETVKEFTSDIMKKLLANSVAVQYSGQGKRGNKKNFSGLHIYKAIVCATLERYQGHGEKEVLSAVAHFLIGARDRGEERKARTLRALCV